MKSTKALCFTLVLSGERTCYGIIQGLCFFHSKFSEGISTHLVLLEQRELGMLVIKLIF